MCAGQRRGNRFFPVEVLSTKLALGRRVALICFNPARLCVCQPLFLICLSFLHNLFQNDCEKPRLLSMPAQVTNRMRTTCRPCQAFGRFVGKHSLCLWLSVCVWLFVIFSQHNATHTQRRCHIQVRVIFLFVCFVWLLNTFPDFRSSIVRTVVYRKSFSV